MKYYVNLKKAYQEDGKYYIQGLASGTLEDRDQQKINLNLLKKFAKYINDTGLPLTNAHRGDGVENELGVLNFAEVIESGDKEYGLFVRGELDIDNPLSSYLVKSVQKGKKLAFSIEGIKPIVRPTWSQRLGKMIDEFVDAIPTAVTVTTKPSYAPSFLNVLQKSYDEGEYTRQDQDAIIKSNILTKENMDKDTTQEVAENAEVTVEDTKQTEVVAETADEVVEGADDGADVEAKETEAEVTEVAEVEEAKTEEVEAEKTEEAEGAELEKSYEARKEGLLKKSEGETIMEKLSSIESQVSELGNKVSALESSEVLAKNFEEVHNVLKSFHTDIEALKEMPLQKKSKVMAKSYEAIKEEKSTLKGALEKVI